VILGQNDMVASTYTTAGEGDTHKVALP